MTTTNLCNSSFGLKSFVDLNKSQKSICSNNDDSNEEKQHFHLIKEQQSPCNFNLCNNIINTTNTIVTTATTTPTITEQIQNQQNNLQQRSLLEELLLQQQEQQQQQQQQQFVKQLYEKSQTKNEKKIRLITTRNFLRCKLLFDPSSPQSITTPKAHLQHLNMAKNMTNNGNSTFIPPSCCFICEKQFSNFESFEESCVISDNVKTIDLKFYKCAFPVFELDFDVKNPINLEQYSNFDDETTSESNFSSVLPSASIVLSTSPPSSSSSLSPPVSPKLLQKPTFIINRKIRYVCCNCIPKELTIDRIMEFKEFVKTMSNIHDDYCLNPKHLKNIPTSTNPLPSPMSLLFNLQTKLPKNTFSSLRNNLILKQQKQKSTFVEAFERIEKTQKTCLCCSKLIDIYNLNTDENQNDESLQIESNIVDIIQLQQTEFFTNLNIELLINCPVVCLSNRDFQLTKTQKTFIENISVRIFFLFYYFLIIIIFYTKKDFLSREVFEYTDSSSVNDFENNFSNDDYENNDDQTTNNDDEIDQEIENRIVNSDENENYIFNESFAENENNFSININGQPTKFENNTENQNNDEYTDDESHQNPDEYHFIFFEKKGNIVYNSKYQRFIRTDLIFCSEICKLLFQKSFETIKSNFFNGNNNQKIDITKFSVIQTKKQFWYVTSCNLITFGDLDILLCIIPRLQSDYDKCF
jgi:hypothetical protein